MKIDLDDLKAKAEAATPGPWEAGRPDIISYHGAGPTRGYKNVYSPPNGETHLGHECSDVVCEALDAVGADCRENAEYIAAANPQVVLELIAEVERLRAGLEHIKSVSERNAQDTDPWKDAPVNEDGVKVLLRGSGVSIHEIYKSLVVACEEILQ